MKLTYTFLALLGLLFMGIAPAAAAPAARPAPDLLGNDVSWPQCGKPFSTGKAPAFAIVGVNGGLANNTNPCLAEQLAWAAGSTGGTAQPKVALYVNTGNPGLAGSWWPTSNIYADVEVANPYGTCTGDVDLACSYMYGYAKAYDDATIRGVSNPGNYFWWLDVEIGNSWQDDTALNRADLEGMVDYLKSITSSVAGAGIGIYSTAYQWGLIAGTVLSDSPLAGLPSWLAGATTLRGAKANCSLPGLTPGSRVSMTQFTPGELDFDYSCH